MNIACDLILFFTWRFQWEWYLEGYISAPVCYKCVFTLFHPITADENVTQNNICLLDMYFIHEIVAFRLNVHIPKTSILLGDLIFNDQHSAPYNNIGYVTFDQAQAEIQQDNPISPREG